MGGGAEEARRRKRGRSPAASASGSSGGASGSQSDSEASAGVDARKGKEASTALGERSTDGSGHKKRDKRADKDGERDRDRKKKKKDKKRREKEKLKEAKRFLKQQLRAAAAGGTDTAAHPGLKAYASLVGGGRGEQPKPARTEEGEALDKEPLPDDIPKLTVEAYFDKAAEFTAWLQSRRQLYFNELSSDEARDLFAEFVEDWNGRRLPAKYYKGEVVAPSRLTSHRWNIRGAPSQPSSATAGVGMAAAMEEERLQRLQQRDERRAKLRKDRQDQKEVLDEMFPKATGRDAKVEKRMARSEEARARAVSPEAAGVPGGGRDVMGAGDDDSFAAAQQREARRREWQDKKRAAKREELSARSAQMQQAEDAKMAELKALVSQAGPMAIRKRT